MSNQALREQLNALARNNHTLNHALRMFDMGQFTYEEALQMAIVQLVAINDSQQKTLIDYAMRQPAPVVMGVSK